MLEWSSRWEQSTRARFTFVRTGMLRRHPISLTGRVLTPMGQFLFAPVGVTPATIGQDIGVRGDSNTASSLCVAPTGTGKKFQIDLTRLPPRCPALCLHTPRRRVDDGVIASRSRALVKTIVEVSSSMPVSGHGAIGGADPVRDNCRAGRHHLGQMPPKAICGVSVSYSGKGMR